MKAMKKYESAEYEHHQHSIKSGAIAFPKELKPMNLNTKYTPAVLYTHAKNYFEQCDNTSISVDKNGNSIPKPKTRSGLCLYLWVGNEYIARKSVDPRFADVISYIRQTTANNLEEGLLTGQYNATWAIFTLKNLEGWTDRTIVDSVVDNNIVITFKT